MLNSQRWLTKRKSRRWSRRERRWRSSRRKTIWLSGLCMNSLMLSSTSMLISCLEIKTGTTRQLLMSSEKRRSNSNRRRGNKRLRSWKLFRIVLIWPILSLLSSCWLPTTGTHRPSLMTISKSKSRRMPREKKKKWKLCKYSKLAKTALISTLLGKVLKTTTGTFKL